MRGCRLNSCSYITPSMCVEYTGELITGSYLELADCEATTLNDILEQVDTLLKTLSDNDGILKSSLTSYNCSLTHITTLISETTGTKAKTAETVVAMLRTMCDLQARIVELETADIYETVLPQEIQLLLVTKTGCFDADVCYPSTLTLKELLIKLINKACP